MVLRVIVEPLQPYSLWITDILEGVVKEATRKGLGISILSDENQISELLSAGEQRNPVLVIGSQEKWFMWICHKLDALEIEKITVSLSAAKVKNSSHVTVDIAQSMESLCEKVILSGHRHPVAFGVHRNTVGDNAKFRSYCSALKKCGVPFTKDSVIFRNKLFEDGERLLAAIDRYDAVICMGDLYAIWVTEFLTKHGIDVPGKVIVTGFGNWISFPRFSVKGVFLPRVYTDLNQLGVEAIHLYQFLLNNASIKTACATIECMMEDKSGLLQCNRSLNIPSQSLGMNVNKEGELVRVYTNDADTMDALRMEALYRSLDSLDRQILLLLCDNCTYATIAEHLYISEGTVKYRIRSIQKAGGFMNRQEMIASIKTHNRIRIE